MNIEKTELTLLSFPVSKCFYIDAISGSIVYFEVSRFIILMPYLEVVYFEKS